ncbi:MAG: hypothetical protein Q9182_001043 [Xanthomendoza sp. 2 TL-2023]
MARGRNHDYSLPPNKSRDVGAWRRKKGEKIWSEPEPMPANRVKNDWVGETKDDLLAKDSMLSDEQRLKPRAYSVPPGKPQRSTKGERKQKHEFDKRNVCSHHEPAKKKRRQTQSNQESPVNQMVVDSVSALSTTQAIAALDISAERDSDDTYRSDEDRSDIYQSPDDQSDEADVRP